MIAHWQDLINTLILGSMYFTKINTTCHVVSISKQKTHSFSCLAKYLTHVYPGSKHDSTLKEALSCFRWGCGPRCHCGVHTQLPCIESIQSTILSIAPDQIQAHFFSPGCFVLSKCPWSIVTTTTNLQMLNFVKGICRNVRFKYSKQFKYWHIQLEHITAKQLASPLFLLKF